MNLKSIAVSVFALGIVSGCSPKHEQTLEEQQKEYQDSLSSLNAANRQADANLAASKEHLADVSGKYLRAYEAWCVYATAPGVASGLKVHIDENRVQAAHEYFSDQARQRLGETAENDIINAKMDHQIEVCATDNAKCMQEKWDLTSMVTHCTETYEQDRLSPQP